MIVCKIPPVVVCLGLLLASAVSRAQDTPGPSTEADRQQVLASIHSWQADPLDPQANNQLVSVYKSFSNFTDITVHVCTLLDGLPKGDKKDSVTIFSGQVMAQAEFVIENSGKKVDRLAEYEAGVEGALRVYEVLLKTNPQDRQKYLDDLIRRRNDGTLDDFVKQRADAACKN